MSLYAAVMPGSPLIKIGFTFYPRQRLLDLRRTACPEIVFIALVEGSLNDERRIHESLAAHHFAAEWFAPAQSVRDMVTSMSVKTNHGVLLTVNKPNRRMRRRPRFTGRSSST